MLFDLPYLRRLTICNSPMLTGESIGHCLRPNAISQVSILNCRYVTSRAWMDILNTFQKSLEDLSIDMGVRRIQLHRLPPLPKMKILQIIAGHLPDDSLDLLLRKVPNLEAFGIDYWISNSFVNDYFPPTAAASSSPKDDVGGSLCCYLTSLSLR